MSAIAPIAELVPHAGPMLLLDQVVDRAPGRARCTVQLRADSTFMVEGRVRAVVALEYMAQAAAACAGEQARGAGAPPGHRFLLGTRELRLAVSHLFAGDTLVIDAEQAYDDGQVGSFRCSARRGEQVVAEAVLNVFQERGGASPP